MGGKEAKERRKLQRLEAQKGATANSSHDQWTPEQKAAAAVARGDKPPTQYPDNRRGKSGDIRASSSRNRKPDAPHKARSKVPAKFAKPLAGKRPLPKNGGPPAKAAPVKKEKSFKKPKHLKRKLEHLDDNDETRENLVQELRQLEERKKELAKTAVPSRKKHTAAATLNANKKDLSVKKPKTVMDDIPDAEEDFPRASPKEAIKPTHRPGSKPDPKKMPTPSTPKDSSKLDSDEPELVMDADEADPVDEEFKDKPSVKAAATVVKEDKKTVKIVPAHTKAKEKLVPDDDSDSDSDVELEEPSKRQRGRGRKRPDTEEEVKAKEEEAKRNAPVKEEAVVAVGKTEKEAPKSDPAKKTKKEDDKRRCVGRKPVSDFVIGERYKGKVVYVKQFGVFIDIGCHSDAFCHVSRLQDGFVDSSENALKEGDEVNPRVVEVDRKQKRLTVSLQSDERIEDEKNSVLARQARNEKRANSKKMKAKKNGGFVDPEVTTVANVADEEAEEPANELVDADGNFLKDESQMTPAEVKRARKLQRRAQRRTQKEQTGISA